jgi:hypothetical protein
MNLGARGQDGGDLVDAEEILPRAGVSALIGPTTIPLLAGLGFLCMDARLQIVCESC